MLSSVIEQLAGPDLRDVLQHPLDQTDLIGGHDDRPPPLRRPTSEN
jgi:hypothetical protein